MYKKNKADVDREQQYQAESDARTLSAHAEITGDQDRHQRALDHMGKTAKKATDDHKTARKAFEKKTKGRLKKVFGGNKGETFEQEKDKDTAQDEAIVNAKE